jgi:OOP family OmpA-OmpF porin
VQAVSEVRYNGATMPEAADPRRARIGALALVLSGAALLTAGHAAAADCSPASGVSTCFDADTLWWTAGEARFASVASAAAPRRGAIAFAALVGYLDRPVLLSVPSPDPEGRDVNVVRGGVGLSLAYAYGLSDQLELTLATPLVLHQTGAGAEGITSQSAPPLKAVAVRDPRVGVGVPWRQGAFAVKARAELALPLGDDDAYAGSGGFTLAPTLAGGWQAGPLHAGVELGARLRRAVPFATARIGSQAYAAVGLGADLWQEWLSLELEAFALPSLVSQPGRRDAASQVHGGVLIPAEWLVSVRSAPVRDAPLALSLGGGTGLPLSTETRETAGGASAERFAGVTTPRFRLFFGVRYQP